MAQKYAMTLMPLGVLTIVAIVGLVAVLGNSSPGESPSSPPALAGKIQFQLRKGYDPANSEEAFTLVLPVGWNFQGEVARPYLDPWLSFEAKDPTKQMSIFAYLSHGPTFLEPSGTCIPACPEGSWWYLTDQFGARLPLDPYFVHRYMPATSYVKFVLLQLLRQDHPDMQLVTVNDRPDLAHQISNPFLEDDSTGADAVFSFAAGGVGYRYGVMVRVWHLGVPTAGGVSIWGADIIGGSAPARNLDDPEGAFVQIYRMVLPTFRLDSQWVRDEIHRRGLTSEQIRETFGRVMQNDYEVFADLSDAKARIGRDWWNVLGGTEEYEDQGVYDHETHTVPALPDACYWWIDATGTMTYTKFEDRPGINYELMKRVSPSSGC